MYRIPKVITINDKLNNIRNDQIILIIDLNSIESNLKGKDFYNAIFRKCKTFEGRVSTHGYIHKINKIINISDGIFNKLYFDGTIRYNVLISCTRFNPKTNDIILGAKAIKRTSIGIDFIYKNTFRIFVQKTKDNNLNDIKINKLYNIKCLNTYMNLDAPSFEITYYGKKRGKSKYKSRNKIYAKEILTQQYDYIYYIKSKDTTYENNMFKCIDYYGDENYIKFKNLISVHNRHHIYIIGEIFTIYNIPPKLRYMYFINNTNNQVNKDNYNLKLIKKLDKIDNTIYSNKLYLELTKNKLWNEYIKFYLNPYELLKPNKHYFKSTSNIISRAYYKFIEIVNKFELKSSNNDNIFLIADAPGGWSQAAFNKFNKFNSNIITTSLKDSTIKYNKIITSNKKIKIDYLKDKTGNILNQNNIKYLIDKYEKSCSIVGCDGALSYDDLKDVSKELQHNKLFLTELIISTFLIKNNGTIFVKLYERNSNVTRRIIYYISKFYKTTFLYKPKSTRIANNESFVILHEFKGIYPNKNNIIKTLSIINESNDYFIGNIFNEIPKYIDDHIVQYNSTLSKIKTFLYEMGYEIIQDKLIFNNKNLIIKKQKEYASKDFFN